MGKWMILTAVLAAGAAVASAGGAQPVYDLSASRRLTLAEVTPKLLTHKIILVGEQHTDEGHHRAQLRVVRALVEAGAKVAVGLEMFRKDSQPALDRWTSGEISPVEFEKIYYDNWNYPWPAYRAVFEYARAERVPMIGLNVPREITRQVARGGFQSLTEAQRGQLADVTCSIDADYMRYIRSAYGAHGHGQTKFSYFCEAQMVWDTAMAIHALDYLKANPDAVVVILTGVGHAQKAAVPRQIRERSQVAVAVMLPEIPGSITPATVDGQAADYLLLDLN